MYESPIDAYITRLNTRRREFEEEKILEAVYSVGVNVNKQELEKALRYDREQYQKGYVDGIKDFAEAYKNQIKNYTGMFTVEGFYVSHSSVLSAVDFICERMVGEG